MTALAANPQAASRGYEFNGWNRMSVDDYVPKPGKSSAPVEGFVHVVISGPLPPRHFIEKSL